MEKLASTHQPLLSRTVEVYKVGYDGATPKRTDLVQQISAKTKGRVIITHINVLAGSQSALVHANIYSDPAVAESLERKNMLAKQVPKAEPAAPEAA